MVKWLTNCVLPGFWEVLASSFTPVSMLIKELLPTLERPIKAISARSGLGHFARSLLLTKKVAFLIMTFK